MKKWTIKDIPSQKDRIAIVTGGTSGIGLETALALAQAGAKVIITGRSAKTGAPATDQIKAAVDKADITFEVLDLADLKSVADFAERMQKKLDTLDILINNAGVMTPPKRLETKEGFELQFGANYLGHFALTKHLLPLLTKSKGRVISLSSVAARTGAIHFDDLQAKKEYIPRRSYDQSKLACLMFAFELQRYSDAHDLGITSVAAHPGIARTNLLVNKDIRGYEGFLRRYAPFMFQSSAQGALPSLFAATSSEAKLGGYYGPDGFKELRGYPTQAHIPPQALDIEVAAKLWAVSEDLLASYAL